MTKDQTPAPEEQAPTDPAPEEPKRARRSRKAPTDALEYIRRQHP